MLLQYICADHFKSCFPLTFNVPLKYLLKRHTLFSDLKKNTFNIFVCTFTFFLFFIDYNQESGGISFAIILAIIFFLKFLILPTYHFISLDCLISLLYIPY